VAGRGGGRQGRVAGRGGGRQGRVVARGGWPGGGGGRNGRVAPLTHTCAPQPSPPAVSAPGAVGLTRASNPLTFFFNPDPNTPSP
jgi:hypothetical protein